MLDAGEVGVEVYRKRVVRYMRGVEEEGGDEYTVRYLGGTGGEGHKGVRTHKEVTETVLT
jgi:hypothetical protein